MIFKNKKVAVLGLGMEGTSSVRWLVKHGASVTIVDRRPEAELRREILEKKILRYEDIKILGGENYLDNLSDFDMIVRAPGVKRNLPQLLEAEKKGVVITSQIKLFMDLCPCPVIGVTGTKGKGTTSSLIYEMLRRQGFGAHLGGNIGVPPLDFLDKLNTQSRVVLELSSFQLQDLDRSPADAKALAGKPHIAVILMITSEHLDYHADTKEYVEAKRNILANQTEKDFAIINRDYPASHESDIYTEGKVFQVSRERDVQQGCFVEDNKIFVKWNKKGAGRFQHAAGDARRPLDDSLEEVSSSLSESRSPDVNRETNAGVGSIFNSPAGWNSPIAKEFIVDAKDILLPGKHNYENVCAAVMAALLSGVEKKNIVSVLKSFKGLEHRLELVGNINGVRYYDDSFSTTPETAIAAIQAFEDPEILILGGSSKGSDFSELGEVIRTAGNIKGIIGIGKEWERIRAKLSITNYLPAGKAGELQIIEGISSMKQAVIEASDLADPGDVVILSPACASFDMFKNYKDRGEQFKAAVKGLHN